MFPYLFQRGPAFAPDGGAAVSRPVAGIPSGGCLPSGPSDFSGKQAPRKNPKTGRAGRTRNKPSVGNQRGRIGRTDAHQPQRLPAPATVHMMLGGNGLQC